MCRRIVENNTDVDKNEEAKQIHDAGPGQKNTLGSTHTTDKIVDTQRMLGRVDGSTLVHHCAITDKYDGTACGN